MPQCLECEQGLEAGPMYRVNPAGEVPAVWAHKSCRPVSAVLDSETVRLAETIHEGDGDE